MARERRKPEDVGIDLTPMIDVVFQLIIFFILTMTISQQDLKSVQLPTAITALEKNDDEALILHIYNDQQNPTNPNEMPKAEGWHITVPKSTTQYRKAAELGTYLVEKAEYYNSQNGTNELGNSEMEILVRGDMRAPSHFFAVILGACQKAKIYKVNISIKPRRDQQ